MERDFQIRVQTASKRLPDDGWSGELRIWLPDQRKPLVWTSVVPGELARNAAGAWCRAVNSCLNMQAGVMSGNTPLANHYAWQTHHAMGQSAQEIAAAAQALMPMIQQGLPIVTNLLRDAGEGIVNLFKGGPDPTRAPAGYVPQGPGDTGVLNQMGDMAQQLAAAVKAQADAQAAGATEEQAYRAAEAAKATVQAAQEAGRIATAAQWRASGGGNGAPPSLPGAGLSLYQAGAGGNPGQSPATTLGTGNILKTALDSASDTPRLFGQLAPEIAGLLSTSLGMYDRAVLSKLGRGDYSGAIQAAHYETSRKMANAMRLARGLLEV